MRTPAAAVATPATPSAEGLFGFLDACHVAMQQKLVTLRNLAVTLEEEGLTDDARLQARQLRDWFNATAREHHMDEEKHVFPALLASGDAAIVEQTQRLIQDHGWLEEDWLEIEPSLSAAADGYTWFDPAVLRHAVGIFEQLYLDHIELEESLAYPEARRHLPPEALTAMGVEMARRRAVREARPAQRAH